jgi:cobaltochelatase CobS
MVSPIRDAGRRALRKAIREHPEFPNRFPTLVGRQLQEAVVKDLYRIARQLGLDPAAIYATATGAARAIASAAAAQPLATPQPPVITSDPYARDEGVAAEVWGADEDGPDEDPTEGAPEEASVADAIENEVRAIRDTVTQKGFSALDERLRELVTEARKPAVTVYVDRSAPAGGDGAPAIVSRPTGAMVTWRKAFRLSGEIGQRATEVWDGAHPDTPEIDPLYVFPGDETAIALTQIARGRNVYTFGPAGTGKTEFAEQLAARLRRPFALISCDASTDGPTLVGMTVPKGDAVAWQDGQLTRAIQIPGCVILIDEPSMARPGALAVLHNVLAKRVLWPGETGRRVPCAQGVLFITADNTAGLGGGARRGYTDTNRLNMAFLDRFGARIDFTYLPEEAEARVIVARTGCTPQLAELLVKAAGLTRAAADAESITNGIGLRRLMAWAELLTDGIDVARAFKVAILNAAPEQDRETLRQQCSLAVDAANVAAALHPVASAPIAADPSVTNPSAAGRAAASDFTLTH